MPRLPLLKEAQKRAVIDGDFKLIQDMLTGDFELYDLREDPKEKNNVHESHPKLFKQMREKLEQCTERAVSKPLVEEERDLTPKELEGLKSLGYVDP